MVSTRLKNHSKKQGGKSIGNEKFGGIAFNVRESYQWYSKLNDDLTDILFKGKLSTYFDSLTVVFGADTSVIANNSNLSQDTLDAVIMGKVSTPINISQLTKGSEIKSVWNRYYNFGYGRKIFGKDSLFVVPSLLRNEIPSRVSDGLPGNN